MKKLILTLIFSSSLLFAQKEIPKQSDLAKRGIAHFFFDFPGSLLNDFLRFYGVDPYTNYVRMHKRNPKRSPWSVFYGTHHKRFPNLDHSFTFVNQDYDFADIAETDFGVCSSMTFGLRRFNMLAHFDVMNEAKQKVPNRETSREAWLKYLAKKIDRIFRLQPTVFPGLSNLNELSSIPELKFYLKKHILNLWVKKNVSIRGLIQLFSVKEKTTVRKNRLLYRQLKARLGRGYNPIIFMSEPRAKILGKVDGDTDESLDHWIHVVQVYKLGPLRFDGSFEFYVWDINEELIEYIQKKVEVKSTGEVHWPDIDVEEGFFKLSAAKLFPQDDREIGIILRNKAWWCHYNPKYKKYCYTRVSR